MGVTFERISRFSFLALSFSSVVLAAPQLRLVSTTVGPVTIAAGANGPAQTVEAYNAGDGTLSLRVTSNASWAAATTGAPRNCSNRPGSCIPIQVALNTSGLSAGMSTAVLTVSDPSAVDAPQTITVSAQIGTGVPDRLEFFVAPNGSEDSRAFTTNSPLSSTITTQSGGQWLSIGLESAGSFSFVLPYRVIARHLAGLAEGTYNGSLALRGSAFAADNKTVAVSMRVTSQPIAALSPASLRIVAAQGAPKQVSGVALSNRGLGSLSVSGVTSSITSGGNWLTAETIAGTTSFLVTADVGSLAPGVYRGSVAVATNAVNGPQNLPVELEVVARAAPVVAYQGVVNNATFEGGEPLAQGVIAALFGDQFRFGDPAQAQSLPLSTTLGEARVLVNEQPVPVYYVSYGQINFQLPYTVPVGDATVRVERGGERSNPVSIRVAAAVPRLLRLGIGNYGIITNNSQGGNFPIPATPGLASSPARAGDVLTIYAIGFGPTTPAVTSGEGAPGAEPLARVVPSPTVLFGGEGIYAGTPVEPLFTGLTPFFVGLYQLNVVVPEELGRNDRLNVSVAVPNAPPSNRVQIAVQ